MPDPKPTPESVEIVKQAVIWEILTDAAGSKVRLRRDIVRAGHVIVRAGLTGVVAKPFLAESRIVAAVRLDDRVPRLSRFQNEVHWLEGDNLHEFEDDIELI